MSERTINLTFHGVGEPPRRLEPGEDAVWLPRRRFLSILDAAAGRDDVRITFDDGNASDLEHALPALCRRGLRARFFVVAGRLGTAGFLDASGVGALVDAGMTIGCHGMRHRPWRRLDDGTLREELLDARHVLEDVAGRPVTAAACPFGAYDRRTVSALRRFGYERVYTSDRGPAPSAAWLQPRTTIGAGDGASVFDRIATADRGRQAALRRRAKRAAKRWR